MQLDQGWRLSQGDDAPLLHWVDVGFSQPTPDKIGIAVSGGGDSMALLHLYVRWAAQTHRPIAAVTVDHGLRPESAQEAAEVAQFCAAHGVVHDILKWDTWDGHGNLQAAARDARYALIADWARRHGITGVALGHTKDDSAETYVMRLARKAGIDGLAVMARQFQRDGMTWARPLWMASRDELRAYLQRNDVTWADDPSNDNADFERVRTRKALETLAEVGVTRDVLHHAAHKAAQARDALDHYTRNEARSQITAQNGDLILPATMDLPAELQRRLWSKAVQWVGRLGYPPRATSINHLRDGLALDDRATAGGCLAIRHGKTIRITREANAVKTLSAPTDQPWDTFWQLIGPHAPDLTIRALGDGIRDCPDWRDTGIPRAALMATPAVWRGETLIAAPVAGLQNGWNAQIVADFHEWLDAH